MRAEALDRVKVVFSLFDANGNGHLEAEDFELMAARVVREARGSGESAKGAMLAAFGNYWATLEAELDADRDGKVTYDEFVDCVLSPERFDSTIGDFAVSLAALGDPDGDGLIERPVFVALMSAIGFDRPNIEALFDAFAPDGSDRILVTTWVAGIRDFYRPDKAETPGNQLVGSVEA